MDTAQLKKYAQESRTALMKSISGKIESVLSSDSLERRESKDAVVALEGLIKEIGKEEVIEKVAYTWFNRFCALRFMDVNRYNKIGIVSPVEGSILPEILAEAQSGYIDTNIVSANDIANVKNLLNGTIKSTNPQGEAYKILFISYCNSLHKQLPFMFEKIKDYTELLLPDDLLVQNSVLSNTIKILDNETCKDIEVIGWLYQYYISEKKDEVFASLKKGKKISKENVPAATQIFTPKWIVSYMVENSVGKLWLESHPDERLQSQFKYYLESAEQEPEVQAKINETIDKNIKPQDIKVLDPACGSGHILVKAFDVLFEIYKSQGWQENEIPEMILNNNLFGLDICDRAAQLSQFAVMMKARQYDRSIFTKIKSLNICSIKDTNWMDSFVIDEILQKCPNDPNSRKQVELLRDTFKDAKEYGSIINVKGIDFDFWNKCLDNFKNEGQIRAYTPIIKGRLPYTLKQARIMQQQYECVIANPPYMGSKGMSPKLSEYVKIKYPLSKGDMFAIFKEVIINKTKRNHYSATINQHSWMFISSYEQLREFLLNNVVIDTMLHLGSRAFEEIGGEVVQTTTYITKKNNLNNYIGKYIKLTNYTNAQLKEERFLEFNPDDVYNCKQNGFSSILGTPIAYWAGDRIRDIFKNNDKLEKFATARVGLMTGDTNRFLRLWYEVKYDKIGFNIKSAEESILSKLKWFPCNKGGGFRKWFGNEDYILNYQNDGYEIFELANNDKRNCQNYPSEFKFKKCVSWSLISTTVPSFRIKENQLSDISGMSFWCNSDGDLNYLLGFCNTKIAYKFLNLINPTLNFPPGAIASLPIIFTTSHQIKQKIDAIVENNIFISKNDWDCFETSWNFKIHPLLKFKENGKVVESFKRWKDYKQKQFNELKANEEELNRLFIEIYGLQDEMTSKLDDKDIALKCSTETEKDCIKSLLSYAVGCMFGRYSLDQEGLIFAGGEFDKSKYKTFPADEDAVIPVLSEHLFSDDLTSRFKEFIKVAFGETHFDENLDYIAGVLGKKNNETADEVLRNYFMKDFYNDHLKMYQKRPIYWMFSSPKGNFNALVYMHRYNKDTVSVILNSYLREYRNKLSANIDQCKRIEVNPSASQADRTKARKQIDTMQGIINEINDYERDILYPLATERKEIDLDDGVKVNYLKFGKALKDFGLKAK